MIPTKRRPKFLNLRAVPIMVFPFQSRFRFIFMDHPGILPRTCTNTCGGLSGLSHKEDGIAIHQPSMFGSSQYKYIICFACLQLRSLLLQMYSDSFWAGFASGLFFCEPILLDQQSARCSSSTRSPAWNTRMQCGWWAASCYSKELDWSWMRVFYQQGLLARKCCQTFCERMIAVVNGTSQIHRELMSWVCVCCWLEY